MAAALVLLLALLVAPASAPKSASAATTPSTTPAVSSKTIVGEIVWVDMTSRLVLVRESVKSTAVKGKPPVRETIAIAVAPDVPVIRGRKTATLAELRPKDHIVARYVPTADGAKAVSVRVAEAAPLAPGSPAAGTPGAETD